VPIRYTIVASPLGRMLVAATEHGVCSIQFGASDEELQTGLRREYPFALRKRDDEDLRRYISALISQLRGVAPDTQLPLDIRATAFQRRVWNHLRTIPQGETRSYSEVARAIGHPASTRAVATACASNPVALTVPCHRVVRNNGELGGYRWGTQRKQALLALESTPDLAKT
jgi:AraC family transcriptional regulator of adaptative response/methylated-DNA-[protein]-cysteine methyltransferase